MSGRNQDPSSEKLGTPALAQAISSLGLAIQQAVDVRTLLAETTEQIGRILQPSRCVAILAERDLAFAQAPVEWSIEISDPSLDPYSVVLAKQVQLLSLKTGAALVVEDALQMALDERSARSLRELQVKSLVAVSVPSTPRATLILYQCDRPRSFSAEEVSFLQAAAHYLGVRLEQLNPRAAVEERQPEERLARESRPIEYSSSSVIQFSNEGAILSTNRTFEVLTGLSSREVAGRSFEAVLNVFVLEADRGEVLDAYRSAFRLGLSTKPLRFRVRHRDSGKVVWVLDQLGPVTDEAGETLGFESISVNINELQAIEEQLQRSEARYRRLVEYSDAIIFYADLRHAVNYISRRALDFFGVAPEDFVSGTPVYWFDLIHPEDRERVKLLAQEAQTAKSSFEGEFRVVNRVTGHSRWLLCRLVPVRADNGELEGWDGFGIDITARREAQEALIVQSKKVRALYTVSSAIRGYLDPANIAYRGLAALCDATGADAGVCYLYSSKGGQRLSLVAQYGFSSRFSERTAEASNLPTLASYVASQGQAVVIPDVANDPRASRELADQEGLRAAVLVPISVEDETLGALGLFSQQPTRFDGGDVMLVGAAASQIGLAARQANLFAAYRKQAKNLSALYRISHELSRNLSLDEIFNHAFGVIRDELGLKRLWLGLLNENSSRLIGQAAYGPGWKRRMVEVNFDLTGSDHPLAKVIASRTPAVIPNPDEALKEFGVKRIFSRLAIHAVAFVPLIAGGQVLGVLAVQPGAEDSELDDEAMTLLTSLANEIAAALLTKRLEDRIAEGERMRTAGLLAGGIAHNFNNLLQAILGQASLLEMQGSSDNRILRAAKIINDAASKGATLVKQLLSFAHLEEANKEALNINSIIRRSQDAFKRTLRERQKLVLNLEENLPRVQVDPSQIVRILTSLISNAADAMKHEGGDIEVFSDTVVVGRGSPHYEVPVGNYVRVGVRDSGVGMDEETRRRCFEPFFTTKNVDPHTGISLSGAGLGLAAAYALARRNGGRLTAESRLGHGSVFTLYVPVGKEPEKAEETPERAEPARRNHPALSLVEDLAPKVEVIKYIPAVPEPVTQVEADEADEDSDTDELEEDIENGKPKDLN